MNKGQILGIDQNAEVQSRQLHGATAPAAGGGQARSTNLRYPAAEGNKQGMHAPEETAKNQASSVASQDSPGKKA